MPACREQRHSSPLLLWLVRDTQRLNMKIPYNPIMSYASDRRACAHEYIYGSTLPVKRHLIVTPASHANYINE